MNDHTHTRRNDVAEELRKFGENVRWWLAHAPERLAERILLPCGVALVLFLACIATARMFRWDWIDRRAAADELPYLLAQSEAASARAHFATPLRFDE